jgi:actin-related protein
MSDEVNTLVIDNGSGICKAGFSRDEAPISVSHQLLEDQNIDNKLFDNQIKSHLLKMKHAFRQVL